MSDHSAIEWTDATWNPTIGCTRVSPGCDNCYAMRMARRFDGTAAAYTGTTNGPDWSGRVNLLGDAQLLRPLHWRKPRRIFVNSMSDLFHDQIPEQFIAHVFAVMSIAQHHTFQILTKRHARMKSLLSRETFADEVDLALHAMMMAGLISQEQAAHAPSLAEQPLPNVWLGVSAEDQHWANLRIPALLHTPAAVRWLSAEPLLGPVDLYGDASGGHRPKMLYALAPGRPYFDGNGSMAIRPTLDWVVVGGESGPCSRPMHPDWARNIRDQCAAARVPFLFKQWGAWAPTGAHGLGRSLDGSRIYVGPPVDEHGCGEELARVGKHAAGRHLDGQLHDGYPASREMAAG